MKLGLSFLQLTATDIYFDIKSLLIFYHLIIILNHDFTVL